jgi:hypothetical protein
MTEETMSQSQKDTEENISAESATEKDNAQDTSSSTGQDEGSKKTDEGEELPWHKDPRFQEFIDQKNTFGADLEEFKAWKKQETAKEAASLDNITVPAWFGGGNQDTNIKKLYKDFLDEQDERIVGKAEERVLNRIKKEKEDQDKAVADANKWFDDSTSAIETKFKTKVDRTKLLKFVMDNELIDSKGRWNYEKGYEFMTALSGKKPASDTNERKQFAGIGPNNAGSEQAEKDVATSDDFSKPANRPW